MLKSYPAKVLLLGEYTILNGSKALALPYKTFAGEWSFSKVESSAREISRKSLDAFISNSSSRNLNLIKMKKDFEEGLWFNSTIPHGYGLGSSGAIIAAIFEQYGIPYEKLALNKEALARLEDFFHGSSSGLDPLVSFLQKPLYIHSFSEVEVLESAPNLDGFFLVNTKKPRQTGSLVSIYQNKMKDNQFSAGCAKVLSKEVNLAIEAVLLGDKTSLFHHLWLISKFQWDFFSEMIPDNERALWAQGLESGDYVLKLCGAGGGGFILGHSHKYNLDQMRKIITSHELLSL